MKKKFLIGLISLNCLLVYSCATILTPMADNCQTKKPLPGEPARKLRPGYLIADIFLFPIGLIFDFNNGKIYKPCKK